MAITKIQSESLNLADTYAFTGTVTGAGGTTAPYFSVRLNASQTISHATATKMNFNTTITESSSGVFDTTNYKFTVATAGKYQITLKARLIDTENNMTRTDFYIYKNGSSLGQFGGITTGSDQDLRGVDGGGSIILNLAASDYIEAYTYGETSDSGTFLLYGESSGIQTYLTGFKMTE